jgi:hypothetical protein
MHRGQPWKTHTISNYQQFKTRNGFGCVAFLYFLLLWQIQQLRTECIAVLHTVYLSHRHGFRPDTVFWLQPTRGKIFSSGFWKAQGIYQHPPFHAKGTQGQISAMADAKQAEFTAGAARIREEMEKHLSTPKAEELAERHMQVRGSVFWQCSVDCWNAEPWLGHSNVCGGRWF